MLPFRPILLSLVLYAAPSSSGVYKKQKAPRAGTVLLDTAANSRLQCALHCLRREDCTHWTFDLPTRRCRLFPLLSSDSAPRVTETIYTSQDVPYGFRSFNGTLKAFRRLFESLISGTDILKRCQLEGPRVTPAVPESEEEFQVLRSLIPPAAFDYDIAWLGLHVTQTAGVYGDMFGNVIPLKLSWMHDNDITSGLPCARMFPEGIDLNNCRAKHSYICQYETY